MSSIISTGTVDGLRTLKDGTVNIHLALQELQPDMVGRLFSFNNQHVKFLISTDNILPEVEEKVKDIEIEPEGKSPSQRLRAVLYRLWEQDNGGYDDFNLFYRNRIEKLIQQVKDKLN